MFGASSQSFGKFLELDGAQPTTGRASWWLSILLALEAFVAMLLGDTAGLLGLYLAVLGPRPFSAGSAGTLMAPKDPSRHTNTSVKECVVVLNGIKAIGASRLLHVLVTEAPGALMQSRLRLLIWMLIAALILSVS